jgi:hypothetical protein
MDTRSTRPAKYADEMRNPHSKEAAGTVSEGRRRMRAVAAK